MNIKLSPNNHCGNILMTIVAIILTVCLYFIFGYIIASTWDFTISRIFNLPEINTGQGAGLLLIINTIRYFKGFITFE